MAVSPFLSTALRSLPSSSATVTASSTSGSVPGSSPGRLRADAGRDHQRRRAVLVGQQRIGAELGQQAHQLGIGRPGGEQERRRADRVERGHAHAGPLRHAGVERPRLFATSFRTNSRLSMLPEPSRRRVVAAGDAGLADPRHLMQRGPALRGGVRIGAAVEQPRGELVVRVRRGEQERVEADLVGVAAERPAAGAGAGLAPRPSPAANRSGSLPPSAASRPRRSGPRARRTATP